MRLLIVEDSPAIAARILEVIATLPDNNPATVCRNIASATAALETYVPDAVVLDCNLAGESGLTVLEAVRAAGRDIPVIAWSGDTNPVQRSRYLELGANYFLDKTEEFDQLEVILKQHLASPKRDAGEIGEQGEYKQA